LGRVRALHPRISLTQFPDGSWNLPPGLARPSGKPGGGLRVKVLELVVQQGVFAFQGRNAGVSGRLQDFAVDVSSPSPEQTRATLQCRRVTLGLPGAEPLIFALDLRLRLEPARALAVEWLKARGGFGELSAS